MANTKKSSIKTVLNNLDELHTTETSKALDFYDRVEKIIERTEIASGEKIVYTSVENSTINTVIQK